MATLLQAARLVNGPLGPVDLALAAGECVAVEGPSGSGKSLLLRALADLDPATGEVTLAGAPRETIPAPAWRRQVGYLPAEPCWWGATASAHMEDADAALALLERVGLAPDVLERPLQQLSTGERQRLALIRALILRPQVLLLDEPTAALDPASTRAIEEIVSERVADGTAVLWVTHDPGQTTRVAHRSVRIESGRLSSVGRK